MERIEPFEREKYRLANVTADRFYGNFFFVRRVFHFVSRYLSLLILCAVLVFLVVLFLPSLIYPTSILIGAFVLSFLMLIFYFQYQTLSQINSADSIFKGHQFVSAGFRSSVSRSQRFVSNEFILLDEISAFLSRRRIKMVNLSSLDWFVYFECMDFRLLLVSCIVFTLCAPAGILLFMVSVAGRFYLFKYRVGRIGIWEERCYATPIKARGIDWTLPPFCKEVRGSFLLFLSLLTQVLKKRKVHGEQPEFKLDECFFVKIEETIPSLYRFDRYDFFLFIISFVLFSLCRIDHNQITLDQFIFPPLLIALCICPSLRTRMTDVLRSSFCICIAFLTSRYPFPCMSERETFNLVATYTGISEFLGFSGFIFFAGILAFLLNRKGLFPWLALFLWPIFVLAFHSLWLTNTSFWMQFSVTLLLAVVIWEVTKKYSRTLIPKSA